MIQLTSEDYFSALNEGVILVDRLGRIRQYNDSAAQIVGIKRSCQQAHPAGQLVAGDIVIAAITNVGHEGTFGIERYFENLGIGIKKIDLGSAVIFAGVVGDNTGQGLIKVKGPKVLLDALSMDKKVAGLPFNVTIDYLSKRLQIAVLGSVYGVSYNQDFSHLVVVDGAKKSVKYYQTVGYSAWGEEIDRILDGLPFHAKRQGENVIDVIGRHFYEFFKKTPITESLLACAVGEAGGIDNREGYLNGKNVLASIVPLKRAGVTRGAILLFSDMTLLKKIEAQRSRTVLQLQKATELLDNQCSYEKEFPTIIGRGRKMRELKQLAHKASASKSNVLILGESGTGKSMLARAIHDAGKQAAGPFIQVNCSSIPETLIESELFGYEKGAFTGANKRGRTGYFELANGGTIFLDEIGDIPLAMQVKLLNVIQERKFFRVGGSGEIDVDVRIIVATNKDLAEAVTNGQFREDLYYRINVFPIHLPALRERLEDIYNLTEHLLPIICQRAGTARKQITSEAINELMHYAWPGNIRELENVLERAVNLSESHYITPKDIIITRDDSRQSGQFDYIRPLKDVLADVEREAISAVLNLTAGDKKRAMSILKIKKTGLYEKIKRYNISS